MPQEIKDQLGIIIVNWKSQPYIFDCLNSLKSNGYDLVTLVVDNASHDGSVEKVKKNFPKTSIVLLDVNAGYAQANNIGIKQFLDEGKKFIFLLNPDTIITSGCIEKLLETLQSKENYGIIGPKIYTKGKTIWACGGIIDKNRFSGGLIGYQKKDKNQYDSLRIVDYIPGTAMMIKSEVFEEVGMLESIFFQYYEDTEFCIKAKKVGFDSVIAADKFIYHKESSSIGYDSPAHQYYMARNHLLFVERNASLYVKLREFIRLPKTIYEHFQKGESGALLGIKDYFLRRFGKRDYWS